MWTERAFLFQTMILPLNYSLLLLLLVLSRSAAPTAVVQLDQGPSAQQVYRALADVPALQVQRASAAQAQALLQGGAVVAVVTIPNAFEARVQAHQPVQLGLQIQKINTEVADRVRRGVRLALASFSARLFPGQMTLLPQEVDAYPHEIELAAYLSASLLVMGSLAAGLLQAGMSTAREWEKGTIAELLCSPAPRLAIVVGQMLAATLLTLCASVPVLLFMTLVIGVWPVHWEFVLLIQVLSTLIFVGLGTVLGNWVRQRQTVALLVRGVPLPLFWLSGIFAPVTFSNAIWALLARLFPTSYAVTLQQTAFFGVRTSPFSITDNVLMECAFLVGVLVWATLLFRRATAPR